MRTLNRIFTAAAATLALGGSVIATATPASAAARDGVCDSGEFCYYYNSNHAGSLSDFTGSLGDYGTEQPSCYEFKSAGSGQGLCIKNEAASAWNRSSVTVRVYYNSGYAGSYQDLAPGAKVNLNATLKNQNASHEFNPSTRTDLSDALYSGGGGRVTCYFDQYTTTPGRHEGIDFAKAVGADVRALVSGQVIYIARGANGSGGLSTISIYNSSLNKSIIYLHTAPRSSLAVGQQISRGQVIADEAWRGVSSSSGAHTHVEMRFGRQTHASKSVNDPVLDNPNPNSFWQSQGYNVR
ncbi:peptidase inhibitor family I36 protein [Actinocorallia populi]|uniref:peptidase inhibitor family I36 protein n=1 Tax=Actinocorallia populi TaxID=2079200 RepID=UPI000D096003|nr:peptidase inhibitor family I36 protein [Actinocorallia populi]